MKPTNIPQGKLRDSVFSQIEPTFFMTKFGPKDKIQFPFSCHLSKTTLKTPVINKQCDGVCYMSALELIMQLKNELKNYRCPICQKQVNSANIIYDPGFDSHVISFALKRGNIVSDYFYINTNGLESDNVEIKTRQDISDAFEKIRLHILNSVQSNKSEDLTVSINRDAIDRQFVRICKNYSVTQLKTDMLIARGRKNITDKGYTTLAFLADNHLYEMKMYVEGQEYVMPKFAEVILSRPINAIFIAAYHHTHLIILKANLKDIEADRVHFKKLCQLTKRHNFGFAADDKYLYVVGGIDLQLAKIYADFLKIDGMTGNVEKLQPLKNDRCAFKVAIQNGKLYVIGGGNRDSGPWKESQYIQYYDFKTKKWAILKIPEFLGYNFGLLPSKFNPNIMIVYFGFRVVTKDLAMPQFYYFNTADNKIEARGQVKQKMDIEFDFENCGMGQSVLRSVCGNKQQLWIIDFKKNPECEIIRKQLQ